MVHDEKTLVLIKNEAIRRQLTGRIIQKFEDAGLKITALKMLYTTEAQWTQHYDNARNTAWIENVGKKAIAIQDHNDKRLLTYFGTTDPYDIGSTIYNWLVSCYVGKPVIALVLQGPSVVEKVKMMVGSNTPAESDLSTIRGTFASDSIAKSHAQRRALHNIVHRSTSLSEAQREISVWFPNAHMR